MDGSMYYNSYPYSPYPYGPTYFPDPWRTTLVPHHFPEHHHLFEKTRHNIGQTLSTLGHTLIHPYETDPPIHNPKADILESEAKYYVDVELPGVDGADRIKLRWLSSRTLLVSATSQRRKPEEDFANDDKTVTDTSAASSAAGNFEIVEKTQDQTKESTNTTDTVPSEKHKTFLTLNERIVGKFVRAFNFPTGVEHHNLTTEYSHGVLRVGIPKVLEQATLNKDTPEKVEKPQGTA